jgi:hypothetical protein
LCYDINKVVNGKVAVKSDMKKLIIKRFMDDGKQTQGRASLYDGHAKMLDFVTLEPPWLQNAIGKSCIPPGIYAVKPRWSPKYGNHFCIQGTSPREWVLFHIGNYMASKNPKTGISDSTGCILVGNAFVDLNRDGLLDISASGLTMQKLLKLAPEGFTLEIIGVK